MNIIQRQLDEALKIVSSHEKIKKMRQQATSNATKHQHKLYQLWTNNIESIIKNNKAIMMKDKPPKQSKINS